MAGSTPQPVERQPSEKQQMFTEQPIQHQPQQDSYPPPQYNSSYAPPVQPPMPMYPPIPTQMAPAIQPTVNVVVNQPDGKNPAFQNSKLSYYSTTYWDRAFSQSVVFMAFFFVTKVPKTGRAKSGCSN